MRKPTKSTGPNVIEKSRETRKTTKSGAKPLPQDKQDLVLALLREGATPLEITRHQGIPSLNSIWATRDAIPEFKKAYDEAVANGARSMLAEAQELARDATSSDDPDAARIADMYMRVTQSYVEKLAPRDFGQLVKLAGDADQAAITVQITSYAKPKDAPAETEKG